MGNLNRGEAWSSTTFGLHTSNGQLLGLKSYLIKIIAKVNKNIMLGVILMRIGFLLTILGYICISITHLNH